MYLLIFDIPREKRYLRVKVNRLLKRCNAKMIQHSVWSCEDLKPITEIALLIRKAGGKAEIFRYKKIV